MIQYVVCSMNNNIDSRWCSPGADLQAEVENLSLRIFYMDNAKEDVRGDIAVMRRAAEKVESEVSKAEVEKQMQVRR